MSVMIDNFILKFQYSQMNHLIAKERERNMAVHPMNLVNTVNAEFQYREKSLTSLFTTKSENQLPVRFLKNQYPRTGQLKMVAFIALFIQTLLLLPEAVELCLKFAIQVLRVKKPYFI